jgi:hypothetical protein
MLLIDAANVVGSRPNGWWRDRAGAARSLVQRVREAVAAGRLAEPVVVVLEGAARAGVSVTSDAHDAVTLVTADRDLRRRAEDLGADVAGPGWFIAMLEG